MGNVWLMLRVGVHGGGECDHCGLRAVFVDECDQMRARSGDEVRSHEAFAYLTLSSSPRVRMRTSLLEPRRCVYERPSLHRRAASIFNRTIRIARQLRGHGTVCSISVTSPPSIFPQPVTQLTHPAPPTCDRRAWYTAAPSSPSLARLGPPDSAPAPTAPQCLAHANPRSSAASR